MDEVNEETWQAFFKEEALYSQYEKCGLEVYPKELVDLTQGRYISPVLQRDRVFNPTGEFSRANVMEFIRQTSTNQEFAIYWKYTEDRMRDAQLMEKYLSLVTQSHYSNSLDLKRVVADRNTTMDITYVAQPTATVKDSTQVTETAMRDYYQKHRKQFEQKNNERDIKYVAFPIVPSEKDIELTEAVIEKVYADFQTLKPADVVNFTTRNSDVPFSSYYYKKGELQPKLDSFAFRATTADVLPVFREDNTFYTARVVKSRMLPDSVRVRYIALDDSNSHLADSLITVLNNGANFGYIAQEYSADPVSKKENGDLGWRRQGTIIDTCFMTPKNKLIKIEAGFGVQILEVTDRSAEERKVQLAIIEKTARPREETYQAIFAEASALATEANTQEEFEAFAAQNNLTVTPAGALEEGDKTITSLGAANVRELVRWAYEVKVGEVSQVIPLDDYFVVATLTAIRDHGIMPFEQVRWNIEYTLSEEQRIDNLAQKMKEAAAGATTIEAIADKMNLSLSTAANISFVNSNMENIAGREQKLQGAVAGAPENVLTGPVKGDMGVYMFTVNRRHVGSAYTVEQERAMEQNRTRYDQMALMQFYNVLEKAANVQDWRGRFF